ncbi:hypothetical protein WS93_27275 [Burkholderia cepacia]|nr:hypothetical protein WS93_27275 [Burkholderia cepacia]
MCRAITLATRDASGTLRGRTDEVEGAYKLYKTLTDMVTARLLGDLLVAADNGNFGKQRQF